MQPIVLLRNNLSHDLAATLRAMIVDGRLPPDERINEVHLARELGVSRTPLREALSRLAAEGAVTNTPRIGYRVRPLTIEEFEQLYDIRPLLDPEALRLAGIPSPSRLARLEDLSASFAAAPDAESAIEQDDRWHLELLADCPNHVLIELIKHVMLRTRRYELALMRDQPNIERSSEDHDRILAALRNDDLDTACEALRDNMRVGRAPIVAWLTARNAALQAKA
jgi:DNA-binding GntR family transcriptional regulator